MAWTYDANGNRLSETASGVLSTYAYPAASNRLASVSPSGGALRSIGYDAAGNIVSDSRGTSPDMTLQYDVEGRLSKAFQTAAPANGGTYGYDAFGRLASKTVTQSVAPLSTTTFYIHDLDDHIIAETDAAGVTKREYIWLNDLPIAVVDGINTASPVLYYMHTDHLGRPARMVAQNWAWAWDVIYSPFGGVSAIFDATSKLDMRFPGQWFQLESRLAYNWHRHYDATLGRYVQPDPMGLAALRSDGPSAYNYARQSPLSHVDPQGENAGLIFLGWFTAGFAWDEYSQYQYNIDKGLTHEQAWRCINLTQSGITGVAFGATGILGSGWAAYFGAAGWMNFWRDVPPWLVGIGAITYSKLYLPSLYFGWTIDGKKCTCPEPAIMHP